MKADYLTRQADIIPREVLGKSITIIGAGAIGSFTALALAKMGFSYIKVYDKDTIDDENMNCQFYPIDSIGVSKVQALQKLVKEFTGTVIRTVEDFYTPEAYGPLRTEIVISAVDSMMVRKMIFDNCAARHLLDARMGAEYISAYHVMMDNKEAVDSYSGTLYSDDEAEHERCTAKATMYTVNLIAGILGKMVKDIATDKMKPISSLQWDVEKNSAVWFTDGTKLTM